MFLWRLIVMSETKKLEAQVRSNAGKGAARAVRREGLVPAVIYGSKKEPVSISLDSKILSKIIFAGHFKTTLFDINVNGQSEHVLPRDVQFDPVKGSVRHVDFLRVGESSIIRVDVPVHFLNDAICPGLKAGGVMNIVEHTIQLFVPANAIPESVDVDLTTLKIGDTVHLSQVNLPAGAKLVQDGEGTVMTIVASKASTSDAKDAADTAPAAEAKK
jgi:large subunit ribosomal protein L25